MTRCSNGKDEMGEQRCSVLEAYKNPHYATISTSRTAAKHSFTEQSHSRVCRWIIRLDDFCLSELI